MTYCKFCMQELRSETARFCPNCGKDLSAETPVHHLAPGTVLNGKYLLGAALGEGGFGITYIGRDRNLDLLVAVKEFYPYGYVNRVYTASPQVTCTTDEKARDYFEKGKARFLQEARALAKFTKEPGVVEVRDYFEENGTAYIVMEFLEGITLKQYLKEHGRLSEEETLELLTPAMEALEKLHRQQLIHRDISPDNLMITEKGIKLLDFGAARSVATDNKSLSVVLKHGFAPIEQYQSRGKQGPWTDIYALCATIYLCITGVLIDESTERVAGDNVKTPSALGVAITPLLERALMKGLAVYPNDRWQTVDAMLAAIRGEEPAEEAFPKTAPLQADHSAEEQNDYDPGATQWLPETNVAGFTNQGGYPDQGGISQNPGGYMDPGGISQNPGGYMDPGGISQNPGAYTNQVGFTDESGYPNPGSYQNPGGYVQNQYPVQPIQPVQPVPGDRSPGGSGKKSKAGLVIGIVLGAVLVLGIAAVLILRPLFRYNAAVTNLESGNYDDAITAFEDLGNYKDSAAKADEARFKKALGLIKEGKYDKGKTLIKEIGSYNYNDDDIYAAMYDYVKKNKDETDLVTYDYLKKLVKENYSDSGDIYDELYQWRVEVVAFNTVKGDNTTIEKTISRFCTYMHVEFILKGGTPDDTEGVTLRNTAIFPDGDENVASWTWDDVKSGDSISVKWDTGIYTNPSKGATGKLTVQVYIDGTKTVIGEASVQVTESGDNGDQASRDWEVELVAANTDTNDINTVLKSVSKTCTYLHMTFKLKSKSSSASGKRTLTHVTYWPDGDVIESDWTWDDIGDGDVFAVEWPNGIYKNANGETGLFEIKVYDADTGEFLGQGSVNITD